MDKITTITVNGAAYDIDVAVEGGYLSEVLTSNLEETARVTAAALNDLNTRTLELGTRVDGKADQSTIDAMESDILTINSEIETIATKVDNGIHTKEQAVAGDIVLVSDKGTIFVTLDTYNEQFQNNTAWEATAIVVVPASHTQDGTVRAMSIRYMDFQNPDTGSLTAKVSLWGGMGQDINDLENYSHSAFFIPSNYRDLTGTANNIDISTKWASSASTSEQHVSPYLSGIVQNSNFAEDYTDPVTNMEGADNTSAIAGQITVDYSTGSVTMNPGLGSYPTVECCLRYHTTHTAAGSWYLPSAGELAYIVARFDEINASFSKFSDTIDGEYLLSSTEKNNTDIWVLLFSTNNGYFGYMYTTSKTGNYYAIAFHKF